jgi:hypothetical protein
VSDNFSPPIQRLSIRDIIEVRCELDQIKPTDAIQETITYLDQIILGFAKSIQTTESANDCPF